MKKILFSFLILILIFSSCVNKGPEGPFEREPDNIVETPIVEQVVEAIGEYEGEGETEAPIEIEGVLEEENTDDSSAPALDLSTSSFTGNGTEPFWGFSASGSMLILREPSDTGPMGTMSFSRVTMTNSGSSVVMNSPDITVILTLETCSDGMSDIVYDYSSSFSSGALSYTGCANLD